MPTPMITFDFEMDTFVSIDAPEGTDPDTLHQQAIELFRDRLAGGEAQVTLFQTFPVFEL